MCYVVKQKMFNIITSSFKANKQTMIKTSSVNSKETDTKNQSNILPSRLAKIKPNNNEFGQGSGEQRSIT